MQSSNAFKPWIINVSPSSSSLCTHDDKIKIESVDDIVCTCECAAASNILVRPTLLSSTRNTHSVGGNSDRFDYLNIDNISRSPSPLDTSRPRVFQPGSIIDSKTYEKILSSVYTPSHMKYIIDDDDQDKQEEEEKNDANGNRNHVIDKQIFNETSLLNYHQYEQEIQQLSQLIRTTQPTNDHIANIIMQELNDMLQTITTTTTAATPVQHCYPPINQIGLIKDHDRPYADYGHLNRQIIAQECQFNLQSQPSPPLHLSISSSPPSLQNQQEQRRQSIRLNAKSFAITAWTNVSKESVMNEIKHEFGIENIQYICIGEEMSELNHRRHLHIQIILKEKIDRRKAFLDEITETHCNYQVTRNDSAWNEYIKKGGNYIEFNEFKSTRRRGIQKYWPSIQSQSQSLSLSSSSSLHLVSSSSCASNIPIDSNIITMNCPITTTNIPAAAATSHRGGQRQQQTVASATEEKQRQKEAIAGHASNLAKTSVNDALIYMRDNSIATDFLRYSHWYKNTFTLIHLLEKTEKARTDNVIKEYTWPESFADCTPALREVVNHWLRTEFNRRSRAKCLILIGGTGIGKTTFAKSLPGQYNYFQGRWRLDSWKDSACYSIFDDIPWDKFDQLGFPSKKALLTQNGITMVTDKYKPSTEINIRQPAIVLLNYDDAGSLINANVTATESNAQHQQQIIDYWRHRAIIYRIGPHEYFHRPDYFPRTN